MDTDQIKLDDNGVPLLETPVDPTRLPNAAQTPEGPAVLPADQQRIDALLQMPSVQQLLNELAEDLQKSITLNVEAILKEEISHLVHQAGERAAPKIAKDIQAHLKLAVPELLANIARRETD
ncbi:MAG: hypothetical protein RQ736_11870 [Thiogranum sp.]|nr:hypothetical protein [Thiogranum sp.]